MTPPDTDDEAWRVQARCRGVPTNLFFPAAGDMAAAREAKAICAACPVRVACRDYAVDRGQREGIWGGVGEYTRRRLRRARKAASTRPGRRRDSTRPVRDRPPPAPQRRSSPCGP